MKNEIKFSENAQRKKSATTMEEEKNSFLENEEKYLQSTQIEEITKCGIASCHPTWLQVFANEKWYVCVYSLILATDFMQLAYFLGTMSTIEKNFQMSATMLGILKSTFEMGYLTTSISLAYFIGKGNKIRWISIALLINGIFCLIRIIPHYMDAHMLENNKDSSLLQLDRTQFVFYFFIVTQIMTGSGRAIIKNSGLTYLDHNVEKNTFPMLYAIVSAVGDSGRFFGYLISFYALSIYVYPTESTRYMEKNNQWIGAWWIGWILISALYIILSMISITFPKRLPTAVLRNIKYQKSKNGKISSSDFFASFKRILHNKIAVLDILGEVSLEVAFSGYEIFIPKYLELQYDLTSSNSSFSLAILRLITGPLSMLITGFSVFRFKPKPRSLIKYNLIMRCIQIGVLTFFIFISCRRQEIQGKRMPDNSLNLTTECNIHNACSGTTKYSPVCHVKQELLFYSPCHAGCLFELNNKNTKVYSNCSCVPDFESVTEGLCPTDCKSAVLTYLITNVIFICFIFSPIRFTKRILRFRIVENEDKSLHYGIRKFLPSAIGLLSSIFCGNMIDHSCLIFENTSRGRGRCVNYNLTKLRYSINLFAIGGVFINIVPEIFIWYYARNIKMYEEDVQMQNNSKTLNEERGITETVTQRLE